MRRVSLFSTLMRTTFLVMNEEIWKDVQGFEGLYQISNLGRVKSLRNGRLRRLQINKWGYEVVILTKDKRQKSLRINRLVAIAFIPNPENLPEVNHIDGDKRNNRVTNLEWASKSYNIKHTFRVGIKDFHGSNGPSARKVIDTRTGVVYGTLKECAEANGYSRTQMGRILRGEIPNVKHFKYKSNVVI